MTGRVNVLIPMAGRGERFSAVGYEVPKPLIEIGGRPMIEWAIQTLDIIGDEVQHIFIARTYKNQDFNDRLDVVMKRVAPKAIVEKIAHVTEGPACTCLLMKELIDNDTPLVISNCDQVMRWNGEYFVNACLHSPYDGLVVTYEESTPKNSYAKISPRGDVLRIEEKNVISNVSLNGIHFWRRGRDFVSSAEEMVAANERYNDEFYVGPTYNRMIARGQRVGIFHIPRECHNAVGVPSDLEMFLDQNPS